MKSFFVKSPILSWSFLFIVVILSFKTYSDYRLNILENERLNIERRLAQNDKLKIMLLDTLNDFSIQKKDSLRLITDILIRAIEKQKAIDSLHRRLNSMKNKSTIESHLEHVKQDSVIIAYVNGLNLPLVKEKILLSDRSINVTDDLILFIQYGSLVYLIGVIFILYKKR
ncbi:MAG: hypothetical protein RLO81_14170 [Fulvivirga sp.]|uniref:hypothetical protein n=1 Tax=Fulvivirga sp. TaxID=1931237 RepID=UPI0032EAED04